MKNTIFLITCFAALVACNSNDQDQQANENKMVTDETDSIKTGNQLNETTIAVLDNAEIFRFTKSNVPEFNWNSFQLTRFWKEDSLIKRPFTPDKDYFENYGPLLKYSPDSSKFIDLDSYNIAISKNNKGERIGLPQGPDTEVSLVDLNKKENTRLVFLGPGNSIEDASWLDNENLVLISSVDNEGASPVASVLKYNLPASTFYVYETTDTSIINNLKGYWKRERLKNVQLR